MSPTIVLPGNYESLTKICHFVEEIARSAGFDEEGMYAIETAVDEAFSNVIDHAYKGEDKGVIECSCDLEGDALTIILHDHGMPFDPDSVPEPIISSELEKRKERGLGLFFMRKLMDEVDFEFSAENGNTLKMVKRKEKQA